MVAQHAQQQQTRIGPHQIKQVWPVGMELCSFPVSFQLGSEPRPTRAHLCRRVGEYKRQRISESLSVEVLDVVTDSTLSLPGQCFSGRRSLWKRSSVQKRTDFDLEIKNKNPDLHHINGRLYTDFIQNGPDFPHTCTIFLHMYHHVPSYQVVL
jgi:hypothetical protein